MLSQYQKTLARLSRSIFALAAVAGASALYAVDAMTVTVDFSTNAYYPLVKERIGLFQEMKPVQTEQQFLDNLALLDELPLSTFRVLSPFPNSGQSFSFNDPTMVYSSGGSVQVQVNPDLDTAFQTLRAKKITPVMSWWGSPVPYQSTGDVTDKPSNVSQYAATMGQLAALYAQGGNLIWEVYNEPDLDMYLNSTNNIADYWNIFKATAPAVKNANADILISGPVLSTGASDTAFNTFVMDFLTEKVTNPGLPLDFFSFHIYNDVTTAAGQIASRRNNVQSDFNAVPFLITEYENYKPSDDDATKALREVSKGAVKVMQHVKMLAEQTDVAAVTWNRFMSFKPDDQNPLPGGWLTYDGVKRATYNAHKLYGWIPADRCTTTLSGTTTGADAFAGKDAHNAGVLVWNDGTAWKNLTINLNNIPAALTSGGRLRVYLIDPSHASWGNGAPEELAVESTQTVNASSVTLSVTLKNPGLVYVRLDDQSGVSLEGRNVLTAAKYIRSWQWCPRVQSGADWISQGNYGTFNPQSWILRVGNNTSTGKGIAGVTMDNVPGTLYVKYASTNVNAGTGVNALAALRVDYWVGGSWTKSVLFRGNSYNSARTDVLPWGRGGATGDVVINKGAAIGNGTEFSININSNAPAGWTGSSNRRCLVTAWTQANGIGSQSVVTLSDVSGQ